MPAAIPSRMAAAPAFLEYPRAFDVGGWGAREWRGL